MIIRIGNLKRDDVKRIIESLPGIQLASGTSPGYEIPINDGHRRKGRVHIMFASDGLEVHRDYVEGKRHKVMHKSKTAKQVYNKLKEAIESYGKVPEPTMQ